MSGGSKTPWGLVAIGAIAIVAVGLVLIATYDPVSHFYSGPVANDACDLECATQQLDLVAQQGMALAAWTMAGVTFASFVLGVVTIVLIRATLLETAKAAKASEAAVAVADKTLAETARIGEAQVRAYMSCTTCVLRPMQMAPTILEIQYANSGLSPARYPQIAGEFIIQQQRVDDGGWSDVSMENFEANLTDVPAGVTGLQQFGVRVGNLPWTGVSWRLLVDGNLHYMDVFDKPQREIVGFELYLHGGGPSTSDELILGRRTNWS